MHLIAGLGNPGTRYENTPHNIGFQLVESLSDSTFWKEEKKSLIYKAQIAGEPVLLAKPQTYMNCSGGPLQALMQYYKIPLQKLIVVVDDIHLVLGAFRIRVEGSPGGHNGLKDIIKHCGSNFVRIRFGVGFVPAGWDMSHFVLKKFNRDENAQVNECIPYFQELIEHGLQNNWPDTMNRFNRKSPA